MFVSFLLTSLCYKIHVYERPQVSSFPKALHFHFFNLGVDGTTVMVLKFSRNRLAICTCSITIKLTGDAIITGTKGTIKVTENHNLKLLCARNKNLVNIIQLLTGQRQVPNVVADVFI